MLPARPSPTRAVHAGAAPTAETPERPLRRGAADQLLLASGFPGGASTLWSSLAKPRFRRAGLRPLPACVRV